MGIQKEGYFREKMHGVGSFSRGSTLVPQRHSQTVWKLASLYHFFKTRRQQTVILLPLGLIFFFYNGWLNALANQERASVPPDKSVVLRRLGRVEESNQENLVDVFQWTSFLLVCFFCFKFCLIRSLYIRSIIKFSQYFRQYWNNIGYLKRNK